MRHSLRNRLAFVFFAITLVAIAALYLYVAPGLRSRLVDERLTQLRPRPGATRSRSSPRSGPAAAIRSGSYGRRWTPPGSPRATA